MISVILGIISFVLFFIYDLNSVGRNRLMFRFFFAVGVLTLLTSCIMTCLQANLNRGPLFWLLCFCAFIFLLLLLYTLFWAIPFEATYVRENRLRSAYTCGVYALCRHPGILWFAGLFCMLWLIFPSAISNIYFPLMIFFNALYALFQDVYSFPLTFENYHSYKSVTPFLIPRPKDIRACITFFRNRGKDEF